MKIRAKLLLAGAILIVAALRPAPAKAWCHVNPFICDDDETCEQTCYAGGCYSYVFDGAACYCS